MIQFEKERAKKVFDEFSAVNGKYWKKRSFNPQSTTILVEGFFAESGPNYVIRIGSIAKALEEIKNSNLVVLLELDEKEEPNKTKIWQSFGMDNFIGIYNDVYANFSSSNKFQIRFWARVYYLWSTLLLLFKSQEKFSQLSFRGVRLGDILYDEIIKNTPVGEYTINKITSKHRHFFKRLFIYFFVSEFIYKKYRPKYYVTTHTQYIPYGLPARYFAHQGAVLVETTDDILFIHDDPTLIPKFHTEVNRMIRRKIDMVYNDEEAQKTAKIELNKRFTGKTQQIDAQMAYGNKQNYSKQMLKEKLNINDDKPIVFIFAHIFSDAIQGNDEMLFPDFYLWLVETIKFVKDIKDVNWIIKPHPSARAYGEVGEVERLIKEIGQASSNLFICPDNFSTASVLECATAIVTAQGTVGLEFSCVGIPIIIVGKPFYSGFGFTYEPSTKAKYFTQLKNIKNIKPLTGDQMRMACSVYSVFFQIQNKDFSLIDTEMKDKTWGAGQEQDILGAFEMMNERLRIIDPKSRNLYNQIKEYFC